MYRGVVIPSRLALYILYSGFSLAHHLLESSKQKLRRKSFLLPGR